jgi:ABC-type spermidine/putrescine transport system permease subunit II
MCLMAGVFTIVISYMRKHGIRLWMRAATAAYFGFFPVIVMFTLCSAKDGIFAGALLLLLLSLDEMGREREKFFTGWQKPLFFCGQSARPLV